MGYKYAVFAFVLLYTNACVSPSDDIRILNQEEVLEESGDALNIAVLENFRNTEEPMNLDSLGENEQEPIHFDPLEQNDQEDVSGRFPLQGNETEAHSNKRSRRQTQPAASLITSISQKCDSIVLTWKLPNIPYSSSYHSENVQFKYYNIYRQTRHFTSVTNLVPIASGEDLLELRDASIQEWIDRDPPVGTPLFYAVTVVDYRGKEVQDVLPQQITFFGTVDNTFIPALPTSIIPPLLKGDVLHHSMAYNPNRNEYMIAFDVDINKDDLPDQLYAVRVSPTGAIVDKTIMNITFGATDLVGYPSVAYNPNTQQYLIALQLRIPAAFQGKSVLVGIISLSTKTEQHGPPIMILKASANGVNIVNSMKPKLIYNSGTGGFAMSALVEVKPAMPHGLGLSLKADATVTSVQPMYKGEVIDIVPVMDTKNQFVLFVFQVPQYSATVVNLQPSANLKNRAYLIGTIIANATGSWINTNADTPRNVVGYTSERNAGIDAYFNPKTQWLTIYWNNRIAKKSVISSAEIRAKPGTYLRKNKDLSCGIKPTQKGSFNPSSCYLPDNNGDVLLWQYDDKIGGYGLKDRTFKPVRGIQSSPRMIHNPGSRQIFVSWLEYSAGRREVFVRNIFPSASAVTCTPACAVTEKCSMHNNCVPQTQAAPKILSSCKVKNGGCSHKCANVLQGRKCSCPATFSLGLNEMKCFPKGSKPDISLLYSTEGSIWSASFYDKQKRVSFRKLSITGKHIVAFVYNEKDKYLYWGDTQEKKIYRALLNGKKKETLVRTQVKLPDGMLVDPDADHLYWTDSILGIIFRYQLVGNKKIPFVVNLVQPRALALHRQKRWLYWTTWGDTGLIERINTDGTQRKVIVSTDLRWPNGLTIVGSRLHWVDGFHGNIEMSNLDGRRRLSFIKSPLLHPFGIIVQGNRVMWTDWTGHIFTMDKRKSSEIEPVVRGITKPFSLQIYDDQSIPQGKFCSDPGTPLNGDRNPKPNKDGKYVVGARVVFTCNPGFKHLGNRQQRCLANNRWTGVTASCVAPPVFTSVLRNESKKLGDSILLYCSVGKVKGVTIHWLKDGKYLYDDSNQQHVGERYPIAKLATSDSGTYTCAAVNLAGEARSSMYLDVVTHVIQACGLPKLHKVARIIGGVRAEEGTIPWQALLWYKPRNKHKGKPFCGGTLLNSRWVVTAAHCFKDINLDNDLKYVTVRLGAHNWRVVKQHEQRIKVGNLYLHQRYNPATYDSDIALIKLNKNAIMNQYIQPICLPVKDEVKMGVVGKISGWGVKNTTADKMVKTLRTVDVDVVNHTTCAKSSKNTVTKNMFCAGNPGGKDACHGDSGGPLTVKDKASGRAVLHGIVSWGEGCGQKGKYGVYTKVYNYLPWFQKFKFI